MPIPGAVMREINSDLKAVLVLAQNECDRHAVALIYSSIDKMAWLQSQSVDHGGKDFQHWIDTYMLCGRQLPFDSEDLWAARCGLLHTGTVESKLYRAGKALRIIYATGPARPDEQVQAELEELITPEVAAKEKFVVLQCSRLQELWFAGIDNFLAAIESDPALEALTRERSAKYLGFALTASE